MTTNFLNNLSDSSKKRNQSHFIETLYSMIESQKYANLISWDTIPGAFMIHRSTLFAEKLLPFLCKHSNFSSFVRQLNMYSFKKYRMKQPPNSVSYWHPFFVRGQPELLKNIVRKNPRHILADKKARLYGGPIDLKSIEPSFSTERKFSLIASSDLESDKSAKSLRSGKSLPSDFGDTKLGAHKWDFIHQYFGNCSPKTAEETTSMIREYLNDDEDGFKDFPEVYEHPKNSKKIKQETEAPNQMHFQYVEMDLNTMDCNFFKSNQPKDSLNATVSKNSKVFAARDYIKCQNLIKGLFESQSKVDTTSYNESEMTDLWSQDF